MRYIDPTLKARILQAQQTLYNNNNPQMEVIAARAKTAITRKELWQELIITPGVTSTCTSIAARKTGRSPDRVFAAYISGGVLTVKSSAIKFPVSLMTWDLETTISGCITCSLEFNGIFVKIGKYKKEYRTETLPWLFYVTSAGAIMAGVLGGPYEAIAAANVTALDAIHGVRSLYGDTDQGMVVFYILSGTLYYNQYVDGAWSGQQQPLISDGESMIPIAPAVCTEVHAERTFDWKIVMQVRDNAGALFEIFSKPAISGHTNIEQLTVNMAMTMDVHEITYWDTSSDDEHLAATVDVAVWALWSMDTQVEEAVNQANVDEDYGYDVLVTFAHGLHGLADNAAAFALHDDSAAGFGATSIVQITEKVALFTFQNFNNAVGNLTLTYTPGTVTGESGQAHAMDPFAFTPSSLVPYEVIPPAPVSVANIIDWSVT